MADGKVTAAMIRNVDMSRRPALVEYLEACCDDFAAAHIATDQAKERAVKKVKKGRTPIEPDPQFHAALIGYGLRHIASVRVTGDRYGNGDFHNYQMEIGHATSKDAKWYGIPPNTVRTRVIAQVKRLFEAKGYGHVAAKGRMGIHWFSKPDARWDTSPGVAAKVGARMDTKHGILSLNIHDYRSL